MTKTTIRWIAQNEETNEDGFYTNSHEADIAELREMGAPEIEQVEIESITPDGWDTAIVKAKVSEAFAEWARQDEHLLILE
jgi:hypothetical protein